MKGELRRERGWSVDRQLEVASVLALLLAMHHDPQALFTVALESTPHNEFSQVTFN